MPLKIDVPDYGVGSLSNLANIAGSMHGEVKPNAGIRDRAMIGDVGANRVGGPFGSKGAEGTSGAAKYLTDPNQFSTWRPTEAAAYKNATGMRDAVLAVGKDPAAFDRLPPQMQQNMLASLAAARGVYGTGELRGISGGSTFYSVIDILSPNRTAEHEARGARSGVNVGGNTFYGNDPETSAKVAQGIKDYDYSGAISNLANNLPQTLATPYRQFQPDLFKPQGQGFNPDSVTNPGVPDASGYGIGDPNFGGGVDALSYDTVRNPASPIASAPLPPERPSDSAFDLRGPLDKLSDSITQGVEGAGNAALGAVQGAAGAVQAAGDAASEGVGNLLQGLMGNGGQPALQPAPTIPAPSATPTIPPGPPEQQIAAVYQQVLGRDGGPGEVGYWAQLLRNGQNDIGSIVAQFQGSPEGQARLIGPQTAQTIGAPQAVQAQSPTPQAQSVGQFYGTSLNPNGSPTQQATNVYQSVLGRTPSADEAGYWGEMLRTGQTDFNKLVSTFQNSPEGRQRLASMPSQDAATIPAPQGISVIGSSQQAQTIAAPTATPTVAAPGAFDAAAYLRDRPDVAADPFFGKNPEAHYRMVGQYETWRPFNGATAAAVPPQSAPTMQAPAASQGLSIMASPTISAGPTAQTVNDIYQAELGRPAEQAAIDYGNALLDGGKVTIADFTAQVRNSPEAQARRNSFPSQDAATIPAPSASPTVENLGFAPTIPAPAATPTIGPNFAPTINPVLAPTIQAPNAVNAYQGISPYDFSGANVSGALGATPQSFGSYYGTGTQNLGLDLPAANSNPIGDFSFSGANVSGFDVNAASTQQGGSGGLVAGFGFDPQASEKAFLNGQAMQIIQQDMAGKGIGNGQNALIASGSITNDAQQNDFVSRQNSNSLQAFLQNAGRPTAAAPTVNAPRVAQGAFAPTPFSGRW